MQPLARFFLVRHAEVDAAWRERVYGDLDVPLSTEGRERSLRAARALGALALDAVVSSGLERADLLAREVVARSSRAPPPARIVEPALREIHRGAWAGRGEAEVEAVSPGGWARFRASGGVIVPPGGETFEALSERVCGALDRLARAHEGGRVLAVAHRWVLTVALARTLGLAHERGACVAVHPLGVAVIDWPAGPGPLLAPRLVALDPDREHLLDLGGASA